MTILDKIIKHKHQEVKSNEALVPIDELKQSNSFARTCFSMKEFVQRQDKSGIIAEFKRKSPSKGLINGTADVITTTLGYEKAGVSGISILTDSRFFGGKNEDLIAARKSLKCPILRKDFIVSEYQIIEAKSIGADVILLIAAVLSKDEIKVFSSLAFDIGMEVLLEIHTEEELEKFTPEIQLVGINNRNLKTFEVDFENSIQLSRKLPAKTVKIAESGIGDYRNIIELKKHGFEGFLIGENFMRTKNPALECQLFIEKIKLENHA